MGIEKIYSRAVMDSAMSDKNRMYLVNANHGSFGTNVQCGDNVGVRLFIGADDRIEGAAFSGMGCALSQASASMMIDLIRNKTVNDARRLVSEFMTMVDGGDAPEELGDTLSFSEISKLLPSRSPCVKLAWETLLDALDGELE